MRTQRERDEAKRADKLREIDRAVDEGRLVIRKMTAAERDRMPRREPAPKRPR